VRPPFVKEEDDGNDSEYRVEESAVDIELLGECGRARISESRFEERSRSVFERPIEKTLNSVPSSVRVGFVMGAEMVLAPRRPCETVLTGTGERGDGPSLSYGTDLSLRSCPETEDCRGLLFFLPKMVSIFAEEENRPQTQTK
jgi:hypothetical protein